MELLFLLEKLCFELRTGGGDDELGARLLVDLARRPHLVKAMRARAEMSALV